MNSIKAIKNDSEYQAALSRLEKVFDAKRGTPEGDELEVLGILVDCYEKEHFPIGLPDPIEAIKFRMEQLCYTPRDLAKALDMKSSPSDFLNRKRKLSLKAIRLLHQRLQIPADVLVQAY